MLDLIFFIYFKPSMYKPISFKTVMGIMLIHTVLILNLEHSQSWAYSKMLNNVLQVNYIAWLYLEWNDPCLLLFFFLWWASSQGVLWKIKLNFLLTNNFLKISQETTSLLQTYHNCDSTNQRISIFIMWKSSSASLLFQFL